jgi:hypothetical protein
MPTLMEIAEHAEVPMEGVLRTLMGEAVSEGIAERVRDAVEELGSPHPAVVQDVGVLAAAPPVEKREPEAAAAVRGQLVESLDRTSVELERRLPDEVGGIVFEAVRVEVQPVTRHLAQMADLIDELRVVVSRTDSIVGEERRARLDDLQLITELIVTGWQTMDRRLARVERMLERAQAGAG